MKTELIFVGKTFDKRFESAIDDYLKRLSHYLPINTTVIPSVKNTKNITEDQQKQMEGQLILQRVLSGDTLILCDERGKEMRSIEFAKWMENAQQKSRKLTLVIGGPYGFSQDVYNRADGLLSFSKMTFSHQMIRLILVEQLYRACTIIKGEPYHHE
jgi:23S rRNA (pseudouridine1915-N3)-methyltransferase